MNINYYSQYIKTMPQVADDYHNNIVTTTDDIKLKNQQILLDGLIKNLSQYTHKIDKDE